MMKFTVFALIAGLCLAAVSATAPEAPVDVDTHSFFGGLYDVLKFTLRTLKGINCALKGVVDLRNAAQDFVDDVEDCGTQASRQVQEVVRACQEIITSCNEILHFKQELCTAENEEGVATKDTPWKCFQDVLVGLLELTYKTEHTVKLIQNVPEISTDATSCLSTACVTLETQFTDFPSYVKECSKLKSD